MPTATKNKTILTKFSSSDLQLNRDERTVGFSFSSKGNICERYYFFSNVQLPEGASAVFLTNGCNGKANIGIFYWAGNAGKVTVTNCALRYSGGCGMYNETNSETQKGDLTQSDNGYYGNASDNICN